MRKYRIYRRYIFILCLLLITAACDKAPTEPEPGLLVLQQRILLDFSSPFQAESQPLIKGNNYKVILRGEFYYNIQDTAFISKSGIHTMYIYRGVKTGFYFTFPNGTPFVTSSSFLTADNLDTALMVSAVYSFEGVCTKTETIKFAFDKTWRGIDLLNTSGIISVKIYMEEK